MKESALYLAGAAAIVGALLFGKKKEAVSGVGAVKRKEGKYAYYVVENASDGSYVAICDTLSEAKDIALNVSRNGSTYLIKGVWDWDDTLLYRISK